MRRTPDGWTVEGGKKEGGKGEGRVMTNLPCQMITGSCLALRSSNLVPVGRSPRPFR